MPRRPRVNGWSPDAQRAFIAVLSATGSKRRAATSIGRNAYGIDQLLKAKTPIPKAAMNASCGMFTEPYSRIRARFGKVPPELRVARVPSFCFSN